jgi:hypothetical protein
VTLPAISLQGSGPGAGDNGGARKLLAKSAPRWGLKFQSFLGQSFALHVLSDLGGQMQPFG